MKQGIFSILKNECIAPSVYKMVLKGDISDITMPGQFINIKLDGFYLRRPISVHDIDTEAGTVTIIYKVVGEGTEYMKDMTEGELDVLTGLGNGFHTELSGDTPVVVGGGVGVPPMFLLAKKLISEGKKVTAVLGFNKKEEIFCEDDFKAIGCETIVATADGSYGVKGFVTDAIATIDTPSFYFACGPEPMLKALYNNVDCDGELSFEERMGCGFGACMGCSCKTKYGNKRICKDGPVMRKGEIIW